MEECKVFRPCFQKATEFAASFETAAVCRQHNTFTLGAGDIFGTQAVPLF
jgi:hypothetical protein